MLIIHNLNFNNQNFATMKESIKQSIREVTVVILGAISLLLMCSEPANEETWFEAFFISKGIAFLLGHISYRLFTYWKSKGLFPGMDDEEKL